MMTSKEKITALHSAYDEAISITVAVNGSLSEREREIAQTAARAASRWVLLEITELLKEYAKNVYPKPND